MVFRILVSIQFLCNKFLQQLRFLHISEQNFARSLWRYYDVIMAVLSGLVFTDSFCLELLAVPLFQTPKLFAFSCFLIQMRLLNMADASLMPAFQFCARMLTSDWLVRFVAPCLIFFY